jgi:hypothetical protein
MAASVFQQVPHRRHVALGVVDGLARALRVLGDLPAPLGEIECQILRRTAPQPRSFDPPLVLWTFRNATGFVIADGTYVHEGQPAVRRVLGDGVYDVRVRGEYYRDREFSLTWPLPPGVARLTLDEPGNPVNIVLLPGPAYPLPDVTLARLQLGPTILRGSLYTPSGDPLSDILVEIVNPPPFLAPPELPPLAPADWPFFESRTSDRGDFVLLLPHRRYIDNTPEVPPGPNPPPITIPITLRIGYDSGPALILLPNVVLGGEHSVANTALRGQVVGPGGRPIADAEITVSTGAQISRSRANGLWFLYFDLDQFPINVLTPVTVTATTPDGAAASDSTASVLRGATVVVPTFQFS